MASLDKRLAEIADALSRSRPPEPAIAAPAYAPSEGVITPDLNAVLQKLASRLEQIEVPVVDTTVLRDLERRVTSLDGKLDASEARLSRLDGVERGIEVLLLQVKELRSQNEKKLQTIQQQLGRQLVGPPGGRGDPA